MTFTRRVVSGTTQLTLSNGVVRLLSIVTMPILTSLLSPQAYGVAALAGTVISLVSVFALAGIDISYMRAYHSAQPPSGADVEHYCWRFAISAALLDSRGRCGSVVVLQQGFRRAGSPSGDPGGAGYRFFCGPHDGANAGALGRQIPSHGLGNHRRRNHLYAVKHRHRRLWRQDALALLLPMLLGYLIPVLLLGTPSIAGLAKPSGLTRNEGMALIKIGLAAVVTAPMYWLLSSSDRWFLQHYHGAEAVGVYSIGYSVAIVGMMVNTQSCLYGCPRPRGNMKKTEHARKSAWAGSCRAWWLRWRSSGWRRGRRRRHHPLAGQ